MQGNVVVVVREEEGKRIIAVDVVGVNNHRSPGDTGGTNFP
jgi:hypothetical protein